MGACSSRQPTKHRLQFKIESLDATIRTLDTAMENYKDELEYKRTRIRELEDTLKQLVHEGLLQSHERDEELSCYKRQISTRMNDMVKAFELEAGEPCK